ncbi:MULTISPECIES: hypothetical protein [Streptomyces]|uniref:hypothetical protein n=1 Tax=Streptomyces TaxID=1883 RepID=UPI001F4E975F|nr:hypothetical protein [Streptomyces sp. ZL-24]
MSMRGRIRTATALTVALLICGSPAWAATPVPPASAVVTADEAASVTALAAEAARNEVTRIAKSSLPAELRTSAWNALRSTLGDEAIAAWLEPGGGYDLAKQRLRDTRTRNRLFCERVVVTHPPAFSPQVNAAAKNAVKGSDNDRAVFVRTGYEQAQQRDRTARAADTAHQQEVAARERDFVRGLSVADPGAEVRVAAQWAMRPGATDTDVAEFFGYGWVNGATLDLEGYRLRVADGETRRHHALSLLLRAAVAAEEALRGASDAAAARAEAERAWQAVAAHAQGAETAWRVEREHAGKQAEAWKGVQALAQGAADELWKRLADPAGENERSWSREEQDAVGSAAFWQDILRQAREGGTRVAG